MVFRKGGGNPINWRWGLMKHPHCCGLKTKIVPSRHVQTQRVPRAHNVCTCNREGRGDKQCTESGSGSHRDGSGGNTHDAIDGSGRHEDGGDDTRRGGSSGTSSNGSLTHHTIGSHAGGK